MAVEESTPTGASPKVSQRTTHKMKFFCSHGGMILPRPNDGRLKYVGGETRVISAPRNVSFSELMRKINQMFEGEFVLKYQILPEELDALVSVKSDEDLHYMFDEYDRLERGGHFKLRTFLFSAKPTMSEGHSPTASTLQSLEQRYVDALNGIVRSTNYHNHFVSAKHPMGISRLKSVCSSQSECTSPSSLSPRSVAHGEPANFIENVNGKLNSLGRVRSSPSLFSLANQNLQPSNSHNHESHRVVYPNYQTSHHHQHQQQHSSYNHTGRAHEHHDSQHSSHNHTGRAHEHHDSQHSSHNHTGRAHEHHDSQSPWMSPVREEYGRVPSMSNHPPTAVPSSAHGRPFHKDGSGGHSRWAHHGQYAGAYSGSSHRTAGIHNEPCGVIWE